MNFLLVIFFSFLLVVKLDAAQGSDGACAAVLAGEQVNQPIIKLREGQDPNPRAGSLTGPWECVANAASCLQYKKAYQTEMTYLQLHNFSSLRNDFISKGKELTKKIDDILGKVKSDELSILKALELLEDPAFFEGSGYVVWRVSSPYELTGVATAGNIEQWMRPIFDGSRVVSPLENELKRFSRPGIVRVLFPNIANGHLPEASENREVMLQYLLTLSEEYYHATQFLMGMNRNRQQYKEDMLISTYLQTYNFGGLPPDHVLNVSASERLEVDVYAKLLEVLGRDLVPERLLIPYPYREIVDREKFSP